jgi:hypothetical protein
MLSETIATDSTTPEHGSGQSGTILAFMHPSSDPDLSLQIRYCTTLNRFGREKVRQENLTGLDFLQLLTCTMLLANVFDTTMVSSARLPIPGARVSLIL